VAHGCPTTRFHRRRQVRRETSPSGSPRRANKGSGAGNRARRTWRTSAPRMQGRGSPIPPSTFHHFDGREPASPGATWTTGGGGAAVLKRRWKAFATLFPDGELRQESAPRRSRPRRHCGPSPGRPTSSACPARPAPAKDAWDDILVAPARLPAIAPAISSRSCPRLDGATCAAPRRRAATVVTES